MRGGPVRWLAFRPLQLTAARANARRTRPSPVYSWMGPTRSVSPSITRCSVLEVDSHHDAPGRGPADPRRNARRDAAAADVELPQAISFPGSVSIGSPRGHRRRARGRSRRQRVRARGDAAAPEARAGDEAGHGPDDVVGLVFRPAHPGTRHRAAGSGRRCGARARTSQRARRRGRRRARWSYPTPGDRSRSAAEREGAVPQREPRPKTHRAASCSAGTGT